MRMKRVFSYGTYIAIIMLGMAGCTKIIDDEGNGNGMLKINGQEYSITECYMTVINDTQVNALNFQKKDENHVIITLNPIELSSNSHIESDNVVEKVEIVIYETTFMYVDSGILIPLVTETRYLDTKNFKMVIDKNNNNCEVSITGKATDQNEKVYDYKMAFNGKIRINKINNKNK